MYIARARNWFSVFLLHFLILWVCLLVFTVQILENMLILN